MNMQVSVIIAVSFFCLLIVTAFVISVLLIRDLLHKQKIYSVFAGYLGDFLVIVSKEGRLIDATPIYISDPLYNSILRQRSFKKIFPAAEYKRFLDYVKGLDAYPDIPFVVLTPFSREVSRRLAGEDFSGVDYVFSWLGNVDLLVAIIKLLEDKMNAENDITHVGIQMILLVEDSVRFYSSVLPALYRFILQQSVIFSTEALNAHERMLRKRGRPKVMLARDYEEALEIYNRYSDNILGVISDVSFKRAGVKDRQAGIMLAKHLRERDPYLPIIIESSESENRDKVQPFGGTFLDKNSKKLPVDLGKAIMEVMK